MNNPQRFPSHPEVRCGTITMARGVERLSLIAFFLGFALPRPYAISRNLTRTSTNTAARRRTKKKTSSLTSGHTPIIILASCRSHGALTAKRAMVSGIAAFGAFHDSSLLSHPSHAVERRGFFASGRDEQKEREWRDGIRAMFGGEPSLYLAPLVLSLSLSHASILTDPSVCLQTRSRRYPPHRHPAFAQSSCPKSTTTTSPSQTTRASRSRIIPKVRAH